MERRDFLKMLAIGPLLGGLLGRGETGKPAVRVETPVENEMTVPVQDAAVNREALLHALTTNEVGEEETRRMLAEFGYRGPLYTPPKWNQP